MTTKENLCVLQAASERCDAELYASPRALERLIELQQAEEQKLTTPSRFRIRVDSGGCAGFQYFFNFDHIKNQEDIIFRAHSLEVIVDEMSLAFLNGVVLDYVEDMMGASFQLKNPNASSSCGCGSSFSI
jgi:iron-sulfur cluster insertion protein